MAIKDRLARRLFRLALRICSDREARWLYLTMGDYWRSARGRSLMSDLDLE